MRVIYFPSDMPCRKYNIEIVKANTEREALCIYLMNHAEMIDAMLWRAKAYFTDDYVWKLASYDDEDNCMTAIEVK